MNIRYFALCVLICPLLTLAGCGPTLAPKVPHVKDEVVSHPVFFESNYTQMSQAEQDQLYAFIAPIHPSATYNIVLSADDGKPLTVARAHSVRNYLIAHGFSKAMMRLQPTPGLSSTTIVLTVGYARALPPAPCPDWSKNSIVDYESQGTSNFGCAQGNNMIMQIANPDDYNQGHGAPVSDNARDSVALQKYTSGAGASGGSASGSSGTPPAGGSTTTTTSTP